MMNCQKVEPASLWYHNDCERVEAEQMLSNAGMIPEMFMVRKIEASTAFLENITSMNLPFRLDELTATIKEKSSRFLW